MEPDSDKSSVDVGENRTRNVSRGLGLMTLQQVANSILGFVFLVSLLRFVSAFQFGEYSAVLVAVGIAVSVASFSLQSAAARYVSMLRQSDELESWQAAKSVFTLVITFSVMSTIAFVVFSPYMSLYFLKTTNGAYLFILGSLWVLTTSVQTIVQGFVQGMKKYVALSKMLFAIKAILVVSTVFGLFVYDNVMIPILAWIIYGIVGTVWGFGIMGSKMFHTPGAYSYRTIMKYSIPLGIGGILTVLSSNADLVIVGGYLNPTSLGVYNAAVLISSTLNLVIITPLITALLPEVSSSQHNGEVVSNVTRLAIRFLTLVLLPCSLLISAMSPQILDLISRGGAYLAGSFSLELIAATYIFLGIELVLFTLLQAIGRTVQGLILAIVMTAVDVGVSLLLVPRIGLEGAAFTRALVAVSGAIVGVYYTRDYLRKLDSKVFYVKSTIASMVSFVVILSLSQLLSDRLVTIVPYSILGLVIFLLCIKILNVIVEEDRTMLSHFLPASLHKILRYL